MPLSVLPAATGQEGDAALPGTGGQCRLVELRAPARSIGQHGHVLVPPGTGATSVSMIFKLVSTAHMWAFGKVDEQL